MIDARHPAGPAFDQARDRIAYLENRLTEALRAQYDEFVKGQEREKEEQEKKAARAKAEYDQAKEKAPHLVKNYDPPVKIKDPHLRRMALDAQKEHQKAVSLERTQLDEKIRFLEKLDRERAKQETFRDNARDLSRKRAHPEFKRAAEEEREPEAHSREQERALSRAFEKAKAQQEQSRNRSQERGQGRDRARSRE